MSKSELSSKDNRIKVCMIVPDPMVQGGIAAVTSGYYGSSLEKEYDITYIQSYRDGSKADKLIKAVVSYFRFIGCLIVNRPSIVHIHSSFGPSFYRKLPFINISHACKIKIVNHIHGAEFEDFYLNASSKKKHRIEKAYNKCDRLISLSDEWRDRLKNIVPDEKITVIPNYSVLHEDAIKGRSKHTDEITVLFLGEIGKRKGAFDIPDIVSNVKKQISEEKRITFVIGGSGTKEDLQEIKNNLSKLEISDMVEFPGWVRGDKKEELLRNADIFLLPSYNEGMPMSILDACGYGLPIVASDVGGIPKIVHNKVNGFTSTPGDVLAFAKGIVTLFEDDEKRHEYGQNSYEIVKEEYSLESHIKSICKVWSDI